MTTETGESRCPAWLETLALLFCGAKLTFLCVYTVRSQYIMDEYAQAGYSIHIPEGFYRALDPIKTVLYVYFYDVARLFAHSSDQLVLIARVETLILAIGIIALVVWSAVRVGMSRGESILAAAVLLSFTNFMEHAFRIRSDSVAAFLIMAAFAAIIVYPGLTGRMAFLSGILLGLAFLCTQKSVYACIAAAAAIIAASIDRRRDALLLGLACLAGFAAALLAYAAYFGGLDVWRVLRMMALSPMNLAAHGAEYYPHFRAYTVQTLVRNWFEYLLCGIGMAAMFPEAFRDARLRAALAFAIVFALLTFIHPQPWPYVYSTLVPLLAVFSPKALRFVPAGRRDAIVVVLLVCLLPTLLRNLAYRRLDNAVQNEVSDTAERLLAPGDRYEDGIGMVTTRRLAGDAWWDAVNSTLLTQAVGRGDFRELSTIDGQQPKLWIFNYRIAQLWSILRPMIVHSYVRVSPNVFLTGTETGSEPAMFMNRWAGKYGLYEASGEIPAAPLVVDGRPMTTPVFIQRGLHRIQLSPGRSGFLLPSGLPLRMPGVVKGPPADLFVNVYD